MLGKGASGSEVLDLNTKEKRNGMDRRHWLLYRERKLRLGSQDQHQMDITLALPGNLKHQTHMWCTFIHAGKTFIHIKKLKLNILLSLSRVQMSKVLPYIHMISNNLQKNEL